MPPPNPKHADLIDELLSMMLSQLDRREYRVTASGSGLGVERVPLTYRIPDLMVFRAAALRRDRAETARDDPLYLGRPRTAGPSVPPPDRKGSVQELLAGYARIAVPEVWLLDPEPLEFTSYRYDSGALNPWLTTETGRVTPLLLPNTTVDLAELWEAYGL